MSVHDGLRFGNSHSRGFPSRKLRFTLLLFSFATSDEPLATMTVSFRSTLSSVRPSVSHSDKGEC